MARRGVSQGVGEVNQALAFESGLFSNASVAFLVTLKEHASMVEQKRRKAKSMYIFQFKGRCPSCKIVRSLIGPASQEEWQALDREVSFRCPICGKSEEVALFINAIQIEEWLNGEEYNRIHRPNDDTMPWDRPHGNLN